MQVFRVTKTLRIKSMMVVIVSVIIMSILMSTISFNAFAATESEISQALSAMKISSSSYAVMSGSTSEMIIDYRASRKMQPGCTTLLVTAMVVIDNMYDDEELDNYVDINAKLASRGDTFVQGESVRVGDLLNLMLVSGNAQAAEALAKYSASKRSVFVNEMNSKCLALRLLDTQFTNPSGAYNTKQYSTAADCAVIMQNALRYEKIKAAFLEKQLSIPVKTDSGEREIKVSASNPLISGTTKEYEDALGGIKGSLSEPEPGSQYVGAAVKDDMQLIVVLMDSSDTRVDEEARKLLDYAGGIATRELVVEAGKVAGHANIRGGAKVRVPAYTAGKGFAYVPPEGSKELIETNTEIFTGLEAPLAAGSKVGEFRIYVGDEMKGTVDLVLNEDVPKGWLPSMIYISNRMCIVFAVILGIALLLMLRIAHVKRRRAKRIEERRKQKIREIARSQMEVDEDRKRRNWTYGGGYEKLAPRTSDIRKEALEKAEAKDE